MKFFRIMSSVCIALACVALAYYAVLVMNAGLTVSFGWIWPLGALLLLAMALLFRSCSRWSRGAGLLTGGLICLLLLSVFLFLIWGTVFIFRSPGEEKPERLDDILILGAQVKASVPSESLIRRLERGLDIALEYPEAEVILSGGKGSGEKISEAEAMRSYLLAHGLSRERIVMEENSTTTMQNLIFSDRLTGCAGKACGIVTSNFHLCRALLFARKVGYTDVHGFGARVRPVLLPHFVLREIAALTVERLRGNI